MTPSPPPIVLVGGPPGAGKTTLARALAARLGVPTQTFDHVVSAIRAVTTPETHPAFHSGRAGHVDYFTDGTPDGLIGDAVQLEEATWPAIERICALAREERTGLVMDWWLLPPRAVARAPVPEIAVWLHVDPAVLEERERANASFFGASAEPERMLRNFMARSQWANGHYATQARELGLPVIEQPGDKTPADLVDEAVVLLTGR